MSNSLLARVSPVTKSLMRKTLPIQMSRLSSAAKEEDIVIHTGQKWDADDYRLVRFTNASKQVNKNWAINLIAEVPPKEVTERVVWCDGGSGPEGHPRIFINLDKPGDHSCGYCGLRFVKKDHH